MKMRQRRYSGTEKRKWNRSNNRAYGNYGAAIKGIEIDIPPILDKNLNGIRTAIVTLDTLRRKLAAIRILTSDDPYWRANRNGPVRELKDMTPDERAALEERYGTKII